MLTRGAFLGAAAGSLLCPASALARVMVDDGPTATAGTAAPPRALPPPTEFFKGFGVLSGDEIARIDERVLAGRMVATGTRRPFVAVHAHHGLQLKGPNLAALDGRWFAPLQDAGVALVLWGFLGDPGSNGTPDPYPEREAELAAELVAQYGAAAYIACAELAYMGPVAVGAELSARFASRFRALLPELPAAVQVLAAPVRPPGFQLTPFTYAFDLAAWTSRGFVVMPECYWGTMTGADPGYEPAHAVRYLEQPAREWRPQLAASWITPTLAAAGYGGPLNHTPAEYETNLEQCGTVGFNVWPLELMDDLEWAVWTAAVRQRLAV